MKYTFSKNDILSRVSSKAFVDIVDKCDTEFYGSIGKEHYKLLSYLSTLFNNSIIIDIGTHRGSSALALSYNSTNIIQLI